MKSNYNEISAASPAEILDESNEFLLKVLNEVNRWSDSELELCQSRSDFQIEKFIIQDSFTIPYAFKTALINRKSVAESILKEVIDTKTRAREFHYKWEGKDKTKPIWWKTPEGGETLSWHDIDEFYFNRTLENLAITFKSLVEELDFFDKIINRLIELNDGKLITKEQFDDDQPEYWQRRLSNQSLDDVIQARTGINAGNASSMRRASSPTVLTNDKNRTKGSFGDVNDPIKLLEDLQKNVEAGILELSGKDSRDKKILFQTQEKFTGSLFNKDLKK